MIKNVIFDVDGVIRVLIDTNLENFLSEDLIKICPPDLLKLTVKEFYKKCFRDNVYYNDYDKGLYTDDEMAEFVSQERGVPIKLFNEVFRYRYKPENNKFFNETLNLIGNLKKAGYKLFILSNMGSNLAEILKKSLNIELFEDILFSCDAHMMKPDLEFYEYAIDKWNINPAECIFIDDRESNLAPFEKLGGSIFLFDKNDPQSSVNILKKLFKLI